MGTVFLTSTIGCCTLLVTCLPKAFHDGSHKFTSGNFECMVCLNKFTLQKITQMNPRLLDTFLHSRRLSQHISPIVVPCSICPVHRSPFDWSRAICGQLNALLYLSQSDARNFFMGPKRRCKVWTV